MENLLLLRCESGRHSAWSEQQAKSSAPEISACIRQADEYFQAAQNVGLPTKPLLLFYCAQTLAKATILANDPDVDLSSLNYHGLNTRPKTAVEPQRSALQSYVADSLSWAIEDEFAVSHAGVFEHLCRVCGDISVLQGVVFRFRELIRIIPDLADTYARHYRQPSHCVYLYSGPSVREGALEVYFSVKSHDDITAVFPEFNTGFQSVFMHDDFPGFRSMSFTEIPFAALSSGTIAGDYLLRPHASGLHKSMPTLFASMFILSNVVRYKPAFWMETIEGRASGSVSMVESFSNTFERRFPNDALDTIWNEEFTFGTPGYVS